VVNPAKAPVEEQSIELTWEQPTDQATSAGPVSNFYIELKPSDSTRWQDVSADFTITEPHCTLPSTGLKEFTSYEFRVTAENKAGKSKPSGPSNPVELVRPLQDIVIREYTGQPTILECELSRTPKEPVRWTKDRKMLTSGTKPTDTHLESDHKETVHRVVLPVLEEERMGTYKIEVEKLSSEAKVEFRIPPTLRLPENFEEKLIMKAGTSKSIEVPFVAVPKPTVEWTCSLATAKRGGEQKPRFKSETGTFSTQLHFTKVQMDDAGDYRMNIRNSLGEISVRVQLIVRDKPSPPRNLSVEDVTGESLVLHWEPPDQLGGYEGPASYVVELREASMRSTKPVGTTTGLFIPVKEGLVLGKSYILSVACKTELGQSEFVESQPILMKLGFDVPNPPTNVRASVTPTRAEPEEQSINLVWDAPAVSDSAPIDVRPSHYLVEMRVVESRTWQKIASQENITLTELVFPATQQSLGPGKLYEFRVFAVNKAGMSEPSRPSNPVELGVVLEFERPLKDLLITDLKPTSYSLDCELSRKPRTAVSWSKDKKPFVLAPTETRIRLVNEGTIQGIVFERLMDTDVGEYAIQVEQLSCQAKLQIEAPPAIPISETFEDRITMKAGSSKIIEVPFVSTPKPTIEWTWAPAPDMRQEQRPRFKPDIVAGLTTLPLSRVRREDSGAFKVTIKNILGEVSQTTFVTVIDKPSAPRKPSITENTGESVVLAWEQPEDLGGCDSPLEYVVMMREAGKRAAQPMTVCSVSELKCTITGLKVGKDYIFSVLARNEVGDSQPVETGPISMKFAFEVPQPPGKPTTEVKETGKVLLKWEEPTSDGGSPIFEYQVESRTTRPSVPGRRRSSTYGAKPKWVPVVKGIQFAPESGLWAELEGLSPDMQYEFHVRAVNKAGAGEFSPRVPGKPGAPTAEAKSDSSVLISWSPAAVSDDYGPADAYQVEAEEDGDGEWKVVGTTSKPDVRELTVNQLDNFKRYLFRVRGVNKEGISEPSKLSNQIYLKKDAPLMITKHLQAVSSDTIPETISFECHISKAAQKVQWFHNVKRLDSADLRKYRITDDVLIHRLDVLKITPDDVGEYSIRVDKLESKANFSLELAPRICIPDDFETTVLINEGSNRTVEIPFVASPPATEIVWYWNGNRALPDSSKRTVPRNDMSGKATLVFTKVDRKDAGLYEAIIKNLYGEAKISLTVKILSCPGPVRALETNVKTPSEVVLIWKPSEDDGGSPITTYRVEQRVLAPAPGSTVRSSARDWVLTATVNAVPEMEEDLFLCKVEKLIEGTTYSFGVSGVNAIGTGPRTETASGVLMKSPFDKPSSPSNVNAKPAGENGVEIQFDLPTTEKDSPITSISIEYRPKGQTRWSSQTFPTSTSVVVPKLDSGTEYEFRVACTNIAGTGEPSAIVRGRTQQPPKPPGAPNLGEVKPFKADGIQVTWVEPEDDGGSPVTSYEIEITEAIGPERWRSAQTYTVDQKRTKEEPFEVTLSKLDDTKSYKVRVIGINKIGTGKPSKASKSITPGEEVNIVRPLTDIWYDELPGAGVNAELVCELTHPNCRVQWLRDGKPLQLGRKFDFTPEDCVYHLTITDVTVDDFGKYQLTCKKLSTEATVGAKNALLIYNQKCLTESNFLTVPPALREDVQMSTERQVPIGSNCVLEVPFKAYPKPTVKWLARGSTVTDATRRYQINIVAGLTSLSIQRVQLDDAGQISVQIENEHGKLNWKCDLTVLDKPGPVEKFAAEVPPFENHILLTWRPPRSDGKTPITGYELEFRNTKRRVWQLLKTGPQDDDTVFNIPVGTIEFQMPVSDKETANSLAAGTEYYFRLTAVNSVGKSEPVETKTAIKAPLLPRAPKLKYDLALETSRLSSGQKHLIPVSVEGEPVPKVTWLFTPDLKTTEPAETLPEHVRTEASGPDKDGINKVSLNFKKVTRKSDGVYTLLAVNSGGEARAEFHVSVTAVPGPIVNLAAICSGKTSVRLTWTPPTDTGGLKLTNYAIEQAEAPNANARPENVTYWQVVTSNLPITEATDGTNVCTFEVTRLVTGKLMFFRVAAENKLGIGAYVNTSEPIVIASPHNIPGQVRNLRGTVDKDGQVLLEWNTPHEDGGSKITNYIIEKSSAPSGAQWIEITTPDSTETKRVLTKLREGECYIRVSAVNDAGKGPASGAIELTVKKMLDEPSAPSQPTVEVVGDGCVQLRWGQPLDEGRAGPVTGYEVQICQLGSTTWRSASDTICQSNQLRLDGLETDKDVMFRVLAINSAGKSKPSEISRHVRPATDVQFVRHLEPVCVTEIPSDVVLECEVSRPGMTLTWSKDGRDLALSSRCVYAVVGDDDKAFCVHRLTLIKIGPSEQGLYTARLPNGLKTETELTIECPPRILYDGSKEIQLVAGKSAVIEVPYSGAPAPDVNWSFNSGPLPVGPVRESPIASVDTVYGLTCIRLRQVTREASGQYKLLVSNELGKDTLDLVVRVLDRPEAVRRLRCAVDDRQPNTAIVAWDEPKDQGGSPITGYLVEKREANKRTWSSLGPAEPGLNRRVTGLTANTAYFFRVMAQNASGCSEPAEMGVPLIIPCTTKPPSTPGTPEVNDIGTNSCRVSWQPPSSDGGARLTYYHLEKRANQKGNWVRATDSKLSISEKDTTSTYTITVTGLVPDNVYEFRVAAENLDNLVSEFSPPSHRASTQVPFSLPGKPSRPEVKNVTEKSATLIWKAPYDDGGDSVKHYLVQYNNTGSPHWETVSEKPVDLEFTVLHLQPDQEYSFRVAAVNTAGPGPWSEATEPCIPAKAVESAMPTLVNPLSNVTLLVGESTELACEFKLGDPKSNVTWLKDNKPIRSQVKYSTSPAWERRATLKMSRVKLEDNGVFTCQAKNTVGTAETSCRVTVCQKPTLNLELDKNSSNQVNTAAGKSDLLNGRVGGRLVLKAICEAVPECEKIIWFIKGHPADSDLTPDLQTRVTIDTPTPTTSRTVSAPIVQQSILTIADLQLNDSGDFGVRTTNSVGSAQAVVRLILSDRPQPPLSVQVSSTRGPDWLEVVWERPPNDGGSKLTGYVVQQRVVASSEGAIAIRDTDWKTVGQVGPYEDRLRLRGCVPNVTYSFRVAAQNDIGTSDPTEIDIPYHFKSLTDVPSSPIHVTAERTSPRDATVSWGEPRELGGDVLQGYLVELRESAEPATSVVSQWTHASTSLIRTGTTFHVTDLHPNMFVQFRVRARNPVGFSEPSGPTEWLKPISKDEKEAPDRRPPAPDEHRKPVDQRIDSGREEPRDIVAEVAALREAARPKKELVTEPPRLELLTGDQYRLRPGNSLRVGVRVTFSTRATVSLRTGSGQELTGSALGRCRVEQFGEDFYVNLRNVSLADAGTYLIRAQNSAGENSLPIRLFVNTEPLPPEAPLSVKVIESVKRDVEGDVVELSWNPSPLRAGETDEYAEPVLGYVVERREGQRRTHFGHPLRLEGPDKLSARISDLKPGVEYVFQVCSYNAVGSSEPLKSEPIVLKAPYIHFYPDLDSFAATGMFSIPGVPDAPLGPLTCSDITESSMKLSWRHPEDDGGLPVKRYQLEMKDVGHPAGWVPLATVPSETTSYIAGALQQGLAYRFRVRALNDEGPSEWLETEKSISFCRPATNPSEPEGPLRLLPDGDNAVRLSWRSPMDDGGVPIKEYVVEACLDQAGDHWQPVGTTTGLSKRVEGLIPDGLYSFRVSACNEAGKIGLPLYSEIYRPASPIAPPGPPIGPLQARGVGIGQLQLDWIAPKIGGAHGFGAPEEYLVERYDGKKARWAYVTRQSVQRGTNVLVSGLQPGGEYRFRVRAENRAGAGPPLEQDKPVIATSPFSPPGAPTGPINISEVQKGPSKADSSARLSWRPPRDTGDLPILRYVAQMRYANTPGWHRIGRRQASFEEVEPSLNLEEAAATTVLVTGLMQSQRYVFRVAAVNEAGTGPFLESEIFEMPEDESCKPKADWIRVVGKSTDSVTIEWLVPHDCRHDHGPGRPHHLAIDSYRVFVRPATSTEVDWQLVGEVDHFLNRLVVGGLRQDRAYYFGVAVVNQSGQGEIMSTTEPVSPEAITTVPSQPIGPLRAYDITEVGCMLSWSSPASDGGSPLLGYRIYKREMYRRSWQEIGRLTETIGLATAKQLTFPVQYLMQATVYEFRVVAENKNGLSEPLDTHVNIHPSKATDIPGPPRGPLKVREVPDDMGSLELTWSPPSETGGLPILGYQLEVREGRSFNWKPYPSESHLIATEPEHKYHPSHVISGIKPNREYFFRICAVNKEGTSQPLTAEDSYVKRVKLAPPKRVIGRRLPQPEEEQESVRPILQVEWEYGPVLSFETHPTGFQIERLDNDSRIADWEPVDFLPITDRSQVNFIHQSIAPKSSGSYKFRVSTVYPEGVSQAVMTGVILASPPSVSRPESSASKETIPSVPSVRVRQEKGLGYDLEWTPPKGVGADSVRGYSIEDWDSERQKWRPVIDIPKSGPLKVTLATSSILDRDHRMRIISRGDTVRSAPTEFSLQEPGDESWRRPYTPSETTKAWETLPSTSGYPVASARVPKPRLPSLMDESDFSLELALITGIDAGTPEVEEFIRQRRQFAQDMVRRDITSSLGRRSAMSQRSTDREVIWTPESPIDRIPSRVSTRTPTRGVLLPSQLIAEEISPTSVRLSWPSLITEPYDTRKPESLDIQKWDASQSKWIPIGQVKPRSTEYTVTGLRSEDDAGWWFRVIPVDSNGTTCGMPLQMDSPIHPRSRNITVPSSVWGVELSPIFAPIDLTQGFMDVNWMNPSNDGGSKLLGCRLIVYDVDADEDREVIVPPNQTSVRLDGLNASHVHRVTITAFNRVGDSMPVTSTAPPRPGTPGLPPTPPPPSNFRADLASGPGMEQSICRLSWRPPSRCTAPIDFYMIEKWDSQSKQWIPFKKLPADAHSVDVPYLLDDVEYGFRIRSQNLAGFSSPLTLQSRIRPGLAKERVAHKMPLPPPKPSGPLELRPAAVQDDSTVRLQSAVEAAYRALELRWEPSHMIREEPDEKTGPIRAYAIEARRRDQKVWALLKRVPATIDHRWKVVFGPEPDIPDRYSALLASRPSSALSRYPETSTDTYTPSYPRRLFGPDVSVLPGEPKDYEFRILAENEFGRSEPLYASVWPSALDRSLLMPERPVTPGSVPDASSYFGGTFPIAPPRGPIRIIPRVGTAMPSERSVPHTPELEEFDVTWHPPYDTRGGVGYEVLYRAPYGDRWYPLGRTGITETSLRLPSSVLDQPSRTVHIGVRTIGTEMAGTDRRVVSDKVEEVLSIPLAIQPHTLPKRRGLTSPVELDRVIMSAPSEVRASLFRPTPTLKGTDEVVVAWCPPVHPDTSYEPWERKQPEKYAIYARELGQTEWREVDRVPGLTTTTHIKRSGLPAVQDLFIGVAPVYGTRIGPIVSTRDAIRLPTERDTPTSVTKDVFAHLPVERFIISPEGPDVARVRWAPSAELTAKLDLYPMVDYHLQVRRPGDLSWRPIRPEKQITERGFESPTYPSLMEFTVDHLKPGQRMELRIAARPSPGESLLPVTDVTHHRLLPPFDIPSKPKGPLIAEIVRARAPVYHSERPSFGSDHYDLDKSVASLLAQPLPDLTEDRAVQLTWHAPTDTGNLPITEYVIERRGGPTTSTSHEWVPVLTVPGMQTTALIPAPSLQRKESLPYFFRVRAVNLMGVGSPLETSQPLVVEGVTEVPSRPSSRTSYPPQLPLAPRGPLRSELLPHGSGVHLEWRPPATDEYRLEEPLIRPATYVVEATEADKPGSQWIELGRVPGTFTSADIPLLPPSRFRTDSSDRSIAMEDEWSRYKPTPILYRVRGENEFGMSAPLVTRVEPFIFPTARRRSLTGLPRFKPGYLEAHLLPEYHVDQIPKIELQWPRLTTYTTPTTRLGSISPDHRTTVSPDIGYLLEARRVGDFGWHPIGTLPIGQETFIYRPSSDEYRAPRSRPSFEIGRYRPESAPTVSIPRVEAYQFRVAPISQLDIGNFLESDIVSWTPVLPPAAPIRGAPTDYRTVTAPSPIAMHITPPMFGGLTLPAPERFQLVDVAVAKPSKDDFLKDSDLGDVILRWHPPAGMSSTLRSAADFVVESWHPERQQWWPVGRCSAAISAETVPGRYDMRITGLPLDQVHHFRVLTQTADAKSEPALLPHPVILPRVDAERLSVPEPPLRLRATPLGAERTGALLTWLPPALAAREDLLAPASASQASRVYTTPPAAYRLEYQAISDLSPRESTAWKHLADLESWQTRFEAVDLEPGKQYLFRIMSVGRTSEGWTPSTSQSRRGLRSAYTTPPVLSEPVQSAPFEVPAAKIPLLHLAGELVVEPVTRPTRTASVSLKWQPSTEPLSGYAVDLFNLDVPTGWRTVTRIPAADVQAPFSGVTITGLTPGQSYRFRVLPYRDDVYGQPLQSSQLYTAPKSVDAVNEDLILRDRIQVPPPQGPLHLVRLSSDMCRLSWASPRLPIGLEVSHRQRLEDEMEYVIEQRLPHRRMWYEVGRTRSQHYLVPLDTTSQFRVRTVLTETPEYTTKQKYALSYDGLQSDWVTVEPKEDLEEEYVPISGRPTMKRRLSKMDVEVELGRIVPDRFVATHVGRASTLLEWKLPDLKEPTYGWLLLEKRTIDDREFGIWEPVAQIPWSTTSYELVGLRPGTKYEFRLVGWDDQTGTRSSKIAYLPAPITTKGASGIPETSRPSWLASPRRFRARVQTDVGEEGIQFDWLSPEVAQAIQSRIRYKLQARAISSTGSLLTDWLTVTSDLVGTSYFVPRIKLDELTSKADLVEQQEVIRGIKRRPVSSMDLDKQQWQFRIIATRDDVESTPAIIDEAITLISPTKRMPIRFLNVKDDRIIYSILGQQLIITVEIEGEPAPSVTWYLNHIQLDDRISSNYRVGQVGAGVFELVIDRVQREHAGLLECRAWNAYETASVTWEVFVSTVPRFSRFGWSMVPREFELKHGDQWQFRIPLEDFDYVQGHEWITKVWLERLTSMPALTDAVPLESRVQLRLTEGYRWVELVVDSISLADAGLYRLWIQNQAGRDYIDLRLRVADKPHIRPDKPRVRPHGPGTLVIDWDIPVSTSRLESEIKYTGYRIEYCREAPGASWTVLGTTPADTTRLLVRSPLEPGVTYRFRVSLENWHGCGPASEPSEPARLPTYGVTDVFDATDDAFRFSDAPFDSRYSIISELARTKHAGLYRVLEKSTGTQWLGKVVDTVSGQAIRSSASAMDYRYEGERTDGLLPRSLSAMDGEILTARRPSSRLSEISQASLTGSADLRRKRAEQELKLLSRIQHEGLAKFHEAYQDARRTISIVEDITAGGTLWHQLSQRIKMTETKAADVLRQLLDLTEQLHRSGVVHLGLQPENIFYTDRSRRRVALAGLGQTQMTDEELPVRLTFRSAVYLPPELSTETAQPPRRIGPASDVWSLGLLLYQMTTGDIDTQPDISRMEKQRLSPKLIKFTKRLLHPDPSKRPTAAEALKDPWLTSITSRAELRSTPTIMTERKRPSIASLIDDEPSDHMVAESISKQAYTRLLRWMDASRLEDELEELETNSERRRRQRRLSQQYLREMEPEERELRQDVVVHARLIPRGQAPEILTPMGSVSAEEGGPAVLRCAVHLPHTRRPLAPLDQMSDLRVYWSLNGRELKLLPPTTKVKQPPSQHYTCTFDPETGDVRLHIDEVTTYDAGTYEVRVVGQYGEVSDSANLRVYGKYSLTNLIDRIVSFIDCL
ncbi:hypothetical protein P879_07292, partial [Paragonimus westermani]